MREEIFNFGDELSLVGILTHKSELKNDNDVCVIFLNAGLIHKIGPNSLYVKIARSLAQNGVCSFRFDYSGMGDSSVSKTNISPNEIKNSEIKQAMDLLKNKINANKFVLIGLCSGAEDAFRATLIDNRVVGQCIIDGVYQDKELLYSIYPVAQKNSTMRYYKKHLFSLKRWVKLLTGKSGVFSRNNIMAIVNMLSSFLKRKIISFKKKSNGDINKSDALHHVDFEIIEWQKLFDREVKTYAIFCEGGTAIDIFNLTISKKLKALNNKALLNVELIKDVDHTFTPIWSQKLLMERISSWIKDI